MEENGTLRRGLNLINGQLICLGVAESFGLTCASNPFDKS